MYSAFFLNLTSNLPINGESFPFGAPTFGAESQQINQIEFEKVINLIKRILEDPSILKIGHNIKFDMNVLRQNHNGNIEVSPVDDTMCMSYCTNPVSYTHLTLPTSDLV